MATEVALCADFAFEEVADFAPASSVVPRIRNKIPAIVTYLTPRPVHTRCTANYLIFTSDTVNRAVVQKVLIRAATYSPSCHRVIPVHTRGADVGVAASKAVGDEGRAEGAGVVEESVGSVRALALLGSRVVDEIGVGEAAGAGCRGGAVGADGEAGGAGSSSGWGFEVLCFAWASVGDGCCNSVVCLPAGCTVLG